MRYSQLFGKTVKSVLSGIRATSHKLLYQGGFIRQVSAGRYAFLPLGYKVWQKIYRIIQQEMDAIGAQQIATPILHPIEIWQVTNRDQAFGDLMLTSQDHRGATFAIGATAEGLMVELVKQFKPSYRDLPIVVYQFVQKFRDELRVRGGLLRVREFMMKDAYSFTATEEESFKVYQQMYDAYLRIAKKLNLDAIPVEADSGAIGGDYGHEFMVLSAAGEDTIFICQACGYAANVEVYEDIRRTKKDKICAKCKKPELQLKKSIEFGHTFKQDHFYTGPHGGNFTDQDGQEKPMWMGAYGIGIGRAMATIVEVHHDENGIIWPVSVAPYEIHLVNLSSKFKVQSSKIYEDLQKAGLEVLWDDRAGVSPGEKFAVADLIGCPWRVVVSDKTLQKDAVEVKRRDEKDVQLVPQAGLVEFFKGRV